MSILDDAIVWIEQARSDARTAEYVARAGHAVFPGDIGCHVALLCAQSFEKCIKGCMSLVGQTPTFTHGVEVAIDVILDQARQRRKGDARRDLSHVFQAKGVRGTVRESRK